MSQSQYLRRIELIVSDSLGNGVNLSELRITFNVVKTDAQTPNAAQINVYNLSEQTVSLIRKEFTNVLLQAGYQSNFGLIFKGTIKQVTNGIENGTDTYITIAAGDGDIAYNSAVVNTTLAAGSNPDTQIQACLAPMYDTGIQAGFISSVPGQNLPRSKVMYGPSRDYLRQLTASSNASWSIQDGKAQVLNDTEVMPGTAFVLNSQTGLIGVPALTTDGVSTRVLLNPQLKIGGAVKIDQQYIQTSTGLTPQPTSTDSGTDSNTDNQSSNANISANGLYRVFTITHSGDSRGNDWYTDFTALQMDATQPEGSQVANNG